MEVYRASPVGIALVTSLNTMIAEKSITRAQATQILESFDDAFFVVRQQHVAVKHMKPEISGTIESYNYLNKNWKLELSDVIINTGHRCLKIERARMLLGLTDG